MKIKNRNRIIATAVFMALFFTILLPFRANALNINVDRDQLAENITSLADYIYYNGYTNGNGYKTVTFNSGEGEEGYIQVTEKGLGFFYHNQTENDGNIYVDMQITFPYSERLSIICDFYVTANGYDSPPNGFESHGAVDPSDYMPERRNIIFIKEAGTVDNDLLQEAGNVCFDAAMNLWDYLLRSKTGADMGYLGFSNMCSHEWSAPEILSAPTYDQAGLKAYTCHNCSMIRGEEIPRLTIPLSSANLGYSSKAFTGAALTPVVTVKGKIDGKLSVLKKGTDFTVTYKNNKNVGTATVTIKGVGRCVGTLTKTFKITKAVNAITKVTASKALKAATLKKKAQAFNIAATVKGGAKKTFARVSVTSKAKKYITVSSAGRVTVKKGLGRGTYILKVKITAKSTNNYKAATTTKTIKIVVK